MSRNKYFIASLLWALVILELSIIPGSEVSKAGLTHFASKLAHFGEFLIFGYLLSNAYPNFKMPLLISLFYAAITEILQIYVPGRSFEYSDIAINFAGALAGIIPLWFNRFRGK